MPLSNGFAVFRLFAEPRNANEIVNTLEKHAKRRGGERKKRQSGEQRYSKNNKYIANIVVKQTQN